MFWRTSPSAKIKNVLPSDLMGYVEALEKKSDDQRLDQIVSWLETLKIPYNLHKYPGGTNLVVKQPGTRKYIGVGSHYDVVRGSPGANDNGSAIAVCMDVLRRHQIQPLKNLGLAVFFFDEEEYGLRGSSAYVNEFPPVDMLGLINLELVGSGDQLALWPVSPSDEGQVLCLLEETSEESRIPVHRFDHIVMNTADHQSFRNAGLNEAFTVTCISQGDLDTAASYYRALHSHTDLREAERILTSAPLFRHYHQPSDLSIHLNEKSLKMVADTVWGTIRKLDAVTQM